MNRTDPVYFDIETGPLPDGELQRLAPPFDATKVKGVEITSREFDPDTDAPLGNRTDPEKIAAHIENKRAAYAAKQAAKIAEIEKARDEHFGKVKDKSALSALSGRILAVGYSSRGEVRIDGDDDERRIVVRWWDIVQQCRKHGRHMIGFNIYHFDLPFLIRRAWLLGLQWPTDIFGGHRGWDPMFIDLHEQWRLGVYGEYVPLKSTMNNKKIGLANAFGAADGYAEEDGGDFARLWASDRGEAKKYLTKDLEMTCHVAEKLGVVLQGD